MRVLLIGADTSIGIALQSHLLRWGRHEVELLNGSACRWKSERQAKKAARRGGCDLIIDARIVAACDSGEILHDIDVKRCHWLAKALHQCTRGSCRRHVPVLPAAPAASTSCCCGLAACRQSSAGWLTVRESIGRWTRLSPSS